MATICKCVDLPELAGQPLIRERKEKKALTLHIFTMHYTLHLYIYIIYITLYIYIALYCSTWTWVTLNSYLTSSKSLELWFLSL